MAWWNLTGKGQTPASTQSTGKPYQSSNQSDADIAVSLKNLAAGGLPTLAIRRINAELAEQNRTFTSDLSVNELAFAHKAGVEPISQVVGSSIYHVGWQYQPCYISTELSTITQAYQHARLLALSRMQQEARMLGAHGVIGVRIDKNSYSWGENLIEFLAVGTAIRVPGAPPTQTPFLSDLSGQDYWALHTNGFRPVGIAFGNCVWYQIASWATQYAQVGFVSSWQNQELTEFTQAVSNTREIAMQRMERETMTFGGEGVVGVTIFDDVIEWEVDTGNDQHRTDLLVRFEAYGTAIAHNVHGLVTPIDYSLPLSD